MTENSRNGLSEIFIWDKTTRWFHWINVLCVLGLIVIGLIILNGDAIGISGEGKILLKQLHVLTGYVFTLNLYWRLIWAFIGSPSARWKSIMPLGKGYFTNFKNYVSGILNGEVPAYLGHTPPGRLMISFLLLLLILQSVTGLVLAGTDIYYPPFGGQIAQWVTDGDPEKLAKLTPGSKEFVDEQMYNEMRAFRKPIITTHLYSFYTLIAAIFLHILSVIMAEVKERNGIISAMFTGRKNLDKTPVDYN